MAKDDKTIMLVEDNPDDEDLVVHALRKHKIKARLQVAHDGVEALDFLTNHHGAPPHVVLLDLKMPRMDGLEVLRRLRQSERGRLVPVVVFTSSTEEADIFRSYALGASSYVRKPIDFDDFAATIAALAKYWLGLNEAPVAHEPPKAHSH